jgi:surface polysaccharide O-acyltransferase-like enzyme
VNRQYGALSGIAVLLIVLNHAIHFGLQVSPVEGRWRGVLILLQALGVFAVPAFLFISGAFLSYAAGGLSLKFMRANLERILWPYVIWSAIFFLLELLTSDAPPSMTGYFRNILVGYPYHFVPLLIFWYVAAPIVVRIGRRHGIALLVAVLAYQVLLLALRFPEMFGAPGLLPRWIEVVRPPVIATSMSDWAIYFPLGLLISMHDRALRPRLVQLRWAAVTATAILFILGILNAFGMVSAPWARFAAPLPLMFLLPTINRDWIPFLRRFEDLGKRSYGIYLSHFVIINVLVFGAIRSNVPLQRAPFVVLPSLFILTLGLSLMLMEAMARIPPARKVYRYVFGIVPPTLRATPLQRPLRAT